MKLLNAAIVGCGNIARVHARAIEQSGLGRLAACVDTDLPRAKTLAGIYEAVPYAALEEMLQIEPLDVVHICTPHFQHLKMIEQVAAKGIAVFTEKPPVISMQDFAALEAAGEKVPLGVCFQNRFNRTVRQIQAWQREGKIGGPKGARAFVTWNRPAAYYNAAPWRGKLAEAGGGVLINQAVHTLDLLVQLLGAPQYVEASMANRHLRGVVEVEDTLEAYVGFPECEALLFASNAYCADERVLLEIDFEHAKVRMEETELWVRWNDGQEEHLAFSPSGSHEKSYWGTGHSTCIKSFYENLLHNTPFAIGPVGVKPTMQAMFGMYESAKTHGRIFMENKTTDRGGKNG